MDRIINLTCHNCGGDLELLGGSLYKCRCCGGEQFLLSDEVGVLCSGAFENLRRGEFDDAEEKFLNVIAMHPEHAEAYWGKALARHGIMFVDDALSRRRVPTCAGIAEDSFTNDKDYLHALSLAPKGIAESYRRLGDEIENVRREWLEKARGEKPYDIFICYKESDTSGFRTPDSYEAQSLYTHFVQLGYNVFFARESLRGKVGEHYEPYIYNALRTSKIMLLYGQKPDNFKAVWVRNEWSRYLGLIDRGLKHSASLIVAYERMQPYDLPMRLCSLQCMDASRKTFLQDLDAHVSRIMLAATPLVGTIDRIEVKHAGKESTYQASDIKLKTIGAGGSATVIMDSDRKERVIKKLLESGMYQKAARMTAEELSAVPNAGKMLYFKLLCDCRVKNEYEFTTMRTFAHSKAIDRIVNNVDRPFAERLLVNCYLLASNLMTTSPKDGAALSAAIFPYDFPERNKCVRKLMKAVACVRGGSVFSNIVNNLSEVDYGADTLAELGDACLAASKFRYAQDCFSLAAKRFGRADAYRGILRAKSSSSLSCRKVEYDSGADLLSYTSEFENVLRALSGRPFEIEVRSALDSIIAKSDDVSRMVKAFNHFIKYYPKGVDDISDLLHLVSNKCLNARRFKDVIYYQSVLLGINDKDPACYWNLMLAKTGSRNVAELLSCGMYIDKLAEYDKFLAVASESDVDKCIALSRRQREGKKEKHKTCKSETHHKEQHHTNKYNDGKTEQVKTGAGRFIAPYILTGIAFIMAISFFSMSFGRGNVSPMFIPPLVLMIIALSLTTSEIKRGGYSHACLPVYIVNSLTFLMVGYLVVEFLFNIIWHIIH